MQCRVEVEKLDRVGESVTWLAWPDGWRVDEASGDERSSVAFDGEALRMRSSDQPAEVIDGARAALLRQQDPFVRFGDWRAHGETLTVIQQLGPEDEPMILVRFGDCSGPAATVYVDATSGRVKGMDGQTFIEGLGQLGQRVRFGDWRDVGGALLPGRVEVRIAHPLIGTITSEVIEVEVGVEATEGFFELSD
jgi:hypothetical protein